MGIKTLLSPEQYKAVKELSETFGVYEPTAVECVSNRTQKELDIILTFLRKYGRMIAI
jgi:hypothetical protein